MRDFSKPQKYTFVSKNFKKLKIKGLTGKTFRKIYIFGQKKFLKVIKTSLIFFLVKLNIHY